MGDRFAARLVDRRRPRIQQLSRPGEFQMERRTLPGEPESTAIGQKCVDILSTLTREDPTFRASASAMFSRPAYEVPVGT